MSLISVLVIAGTGRPYLTAALQSLVRQDFTDWEAIVVEACADPVDTAAVLRQVADVADARILVINYTGERDYPPYAGRKWNAALKYATGSLIAFLDDDDLKEEGWLSAMAAPLLADGRLMTTLCDAISIDASGNKHGVLGASLARDALLAPNFVTTGQMMIRRTALEIVGRLDDDLPCSEDYDLAIRLSALPWLNVRSVNTLHREGVKNASQHETVYGHTQTALRHICRKHNINLSIVKE